MRRVSQPSGALTRVAAFFYKITNKPAASSTTNRLTTSRATAVSTDVIPGTRHRIGRGLGNIFGLKNITAHKLQLIHPSKRGCKARIHVILRTINIMCVGMYQYMPKVRTIFVRQGILCFAGQKKKKTVRYTYGTEANRTPDNKQC